ncbi:MAG: hypothetical protein AB9891_12725 [Anaerolineaceae bacterium]
MLKFIMDLLIGLIVTTISIVFLYQGVQIKHKKRVIIFPQNLILKIIKIIFGTAIMKKREDLYFQRKEFFERYVFISGLLGTIGGVSYILLTIIKML